MQSAVVNTKLTLTYNMIHKNIAKHTAQSNDLTMTKDSSFRIEDDNEMKDGYTAFLFIYIFVSTYDRVCMWLIVYSDQADFFFFRKWDNSLSPNDCEHRRIRN